MVEDDNVDRELADAFREQREASIAGFARLEALIAKDRETVHAHMLDDAKAISILDERTKAFHRRMDEHIGHHNTEKSGRVQLWIGVILAIVAAAFSALFSMFGGKKA